MFYEEIRTKNDICYISICSFSILCNSKFIIMTTSLGTNAVGVTRFIVLTTYKRRNARKRNVSSDMCTQRKTGHVLDSQGRIVSLCSQIILWSDCSDADLSLRWAHMSDGTPLWKHAYSNILKFLPPKNENFQIQNSGISHISSQKHRLCVLVRTASQRRF